MTIRFSTHHSVGGCDGASPSAVFDHDRLPQRLTHSGGDGAHDQIGSTTWCIGHDQADGFGWKIICCTLRKNRANTAQSQGEEPTGFAKK